ncbi:MAG: Grx4 family monothiol glutaredoxin [Thermoleophilia bacterium]|nr:Grx4 family monothiol glutaredoxin [Thermoleophilia bacterium]
MTDHTQGDAPQAEILSTEDLTTQINAKIDEHPVLLFMKGTPDQPYCGFSARTVAALDGIGASYAAVDVLPDPRIRAIVSAHSDWPTIPQLFVDGTLVGGCDIITEMAETGELTELIQTVGR